MNTAEKLMSRNKAIDYYKPTFSKEELETVLNCLVDDQVYSGSMVDRFEKDFKSTFKYKHVISVNSLTAAYHLSLLSLGVGKDDPVLLSTFAPLSAFDAILMIGARPVLVDLGKSSFQMDSEQVKEKISSENPKAILLDHAFGCIVDFKNYEIGEIPTIEDYSEAIGGEVDDIPVGKQGTISVCGLASGHVLTIGNGAVITTSQEIYATQMRNLKYTRNLKRKDSNPKYDYNIMDYQAGIAIEQLSKLGVIIERKKKIAQVYLQAVLAASHETYFKRAAFDQFNRFPVIITKPFEEIERYFNSIQIGTERTAEQPIHQILDLPASDYPNAERLFQRGHCIPIYPNLTKDNVNRIANSIRGIY